MNSIKKHVTRTAIAGIVALLPIASMVLTVVYLENQLAVWLKGGGFYFFGMGLILAAVIVYVVGLVAANFIGRWLWNGVDRLVDSVPILGSVYQTIKQILGYGEGPDAFFQRVVFVPAQESIGETLGLVTNENPFPEDPTQQSSIAVFLPTSPSLASGKLIFVERSQVRDANLSVNQAMKSLVSVGASLGTESTA